MMDFQYHQKSHKNPVNEPKKNLNLKVKILNTYFGKISKNTL